MCVLPVVQYQEADNGSGFFGLQWDQGEECNNNMTEQRAQVCRLHAPHKTLPRPVHTGRMQGGGCEMCIDKNKIKTINKLKKKVTCQSLQKEYGTDMQFPCDLKM